MNIAFDIDGVLADFHAEFAKTVHECYPEITEAIAASPNDWYYTGIIPEGKTAETFQRFLDQENVWTRLRPLRGAHELAANLEKLQQAGVCVYYMTARSPSAGAPLMIQTNYWLDNLRLLRDNTALSIVEHGEQKKAVCEALGITFSIDDRIEVVQNNNQYSGHHSFLLTRSWNLSGTWLPRVDTVSEFCGIVLQAADWYVKPFND